MLGRARGGTGEVHVDEDHGARARQRVASEDASGEVRDLGACALCHGSPTAGHLPAPVTITDLATVRKLAAVIEGLPLSTIPADTPCPFSLHRFLSMTFRARPGGPALAIAQTDQECDGVTLTVRGEQQSPLQNEPALDPQILKLAGLPWKLPYQGLAVSTASGQTPPVASGTGGARPGV